jgi:hypothetical protein
MIASSANAAGPNSSTYSAPSGANVACAQLSLGLARRQRVQSGCAAIAVARAEQRRRQRERISRAESAMGAAVE